MFRYLHRRSAKKQLNAMFAESMGAALSTPHGLDESEATERRAQEGDGTPEVYRLEDDDSWSVRDDTLADRLGVTSHHEAENRVRKALKRADPDLHSRIEFDSEADVFFAYAETEDDAEALRTFIVGLG